MKRQLVAVIVLYRMTPEESTSYRSLLAAAQHVSADVLALSVVLYDNTPRDEPRGALPANVMYVQDASNSGLATAYNYASDLALEKGCEWLLTLDQDTELPPDYMTGLLRILDEVEQRPDIAAVVPEIHASGRIVSPYYFLGGWLPRWFAAGYTGVPGRTVYAFNSGSVIRTRTLRQVGGYSPRFWLDHSDSHLYRQLAKFGKRVYVAGSLQLDHDFSMLQMEERISPERYRTILQAESAFWDMEMNGFAGLERTMRLAGRLLKHAVRGDSAELRRLTWQGVWSRLVRSRKSRLERWRKDTEFGFNGSNLKRVESHRPAVSVCMAAYNGARYIEAQLRSILPQLNATDEIIIIDDASRDTTLEVIEKLAREVAEDASAPRFVVVRHAVNRGVTRTFDEALRCASGDILFLADDDDLWVHNRVARVLEVFAAQPRTQIVATGLTLIDENDQPLQNADFLRHRNFTAGLFANLWHNQFQGSAMAMRSSLLREILPLPVDKLFLHDVWIGMRNTLAGGEASFIDEPLLLYRRHAGNYSKRFGRTRQILLRLQLVAAHVARARQRL